jgi:hypothetical protein
MEILDSGHERRRWRGDDQRASGDDQRASATTHPPSTGLAPATATTTLPSTSTRTATSPDPRRREATERVGSGSPPRWRPGRSSAA